jgi:hypothetical protein
MRIAFRTVSGETFSLEAEDSTTVGELKAGVVEAKSIPKSDLKLVYRWIMQESNFIVIW